MKYQWIVLGLLLAGGLTAWAQMDPNMDMSAKTPDAKFMADMDVAMKTMDKGMSGAPMDGDVDHDFVTMMIPHHQGAIDMAKGELQYGKNPEMRALAKKIIVDQQKEIDEMNLWLKNHPDPSAHPPVKP